MDNPDLVSTQNLYEGSFLFCRGFKIAGKKRDGSKVTLYFSGKNVREESLKFYNGGKVDAKAYSDSYRTLKDFVFER